MTTTITAGSLTITPELIEGWSAAQESRNVIHTIIGSPYPDVTLKPARARTGTLSLFFSIPADALSARSILMTGAVFTIHSTDTDWLDGLTFVLAGSITSALEDTTRRAWLIAADFQEVLT